MEAIIKADPQRGPGHGIIVITGAGPLHEGQLTDLSFVLQRAEDKRSLAANGCWQESASPLKPDTWQIQNDILCLAVGPALVNELDMLGAYRIQITGCQGNDQINNQACVLSMGQLVYSDMGGGQGIIGVDEEKKPQTQAAPADTPAGKPAENGVNQEEKPKMPEPEPQPEQPAREPEAQAQQEQLPEKDQPDARQEAVGIGHLSMEVEPKKQSSGNGLALLAVLAVLGLLAWAGWSWLQKSGEEGAKPLPPIGQQGKKSPPLPDPRNTQGPRGTGSKADAKPDSNQDTGNAGKTGALAQAREHLRGSADPATSLALARPLRTADASPEQADASFLLLEDAAQKGQAEAMYLLAQFYDPVSTLPRGSIPIDMEQARLWYARAVENGINKADMALKDLHEHASREARNGNALARRLLREWKQ